MIQILVLLEVKDWMPFKEFESQAIKIMKKHGGKLVSGFEVDKNVSSDAVVGEVHLLEFPSAESFNNYRGDPKLSELRALRERAILSTKIYVSERLVSYD